MSQKRSTPTDDLTRGFLNANVSRRRLLQAAVGTGVMVPSLGAPLTALARQTTSGKKGGTAVLAVSADPLSWDVTQATWPTWQAVIHLYDRLLNFDEAEHLQPGLALSHEVSKDGLEYTLKLRPGVKFHDGTPFNADAVKFNIQRNIDKPDSTWYTTYEPVDHVEVVDELTAKIVLKQVRPNFAYEGLSQWGAAQISPTAYKAAGDKYGTPGHPPVGTGPFKFASYDSGSIIKYVRNEAYWNGAPLLDGVNVRIIPEPTTQVLELEAKTVDAIQPQPKDVEELKSKGAIIESQISPGTSIFALNCSREPTSELAVRQAIALSIDRDAMIKSLLYGYAEKSRAGVTKASPFYNADVPMVDYDPDKAGKILDTAGWTKGSNGIRQRDGKPLFISIWSANFADWPLYNQAIQEQIKKVGIDSKITSFEWNTYLDRWRTNQEDWTGSYHQQGSIQASTSPIQISWAPKDYWTVTQIIHAKSPDLVKVSQQLQKLSDEFDVTLGDDKRKAIAKQAQMIFAQNQLTVWLWHGATINAIQPRLKGYRITHAGRVVELDKAWIE